MHRDRIKLVDVWLYMTVAIGAATELLGLGYLLYHDCTLIIGGLK